MARLSVPPGIHDVIPAAGKMSRTMAIPFSALPKAEGTRIKLHAEASHDPVSLARKKTADAFQHDRICHVYVSGQ